MERTPENIKKVSNNYLEGLEWVFKYYTKGCVNWRWKYNYHYPPLFVDLEKHIPQLEMDFLKQDSKTAFDSRVQLSYVLPKKALSLLPTKICDFLVSNYLDFYPEEYEFQWSFCRYFWESHPILPEIPIELLERWEIQFKMTDKPLI